MRSQYSARKLLVKATILAYAMVTATLLGETANNNIQLSLACPEPGSNASGNATVTSGSTSFQATCRQVSTGYTKLAIDTDAMDTTTLSYLDASLRDHGELYSFLVPNFMLIVPPFGEPATPLYSKTPIYTVASTCPGSGEKTLNWIYVQFPNGQTKLTGTKLLGYATYDRAKEPSRGITVKAQWDLNGNPFFLGDLYIPGQCNAQTGKFNATGTTPNTSGEIVFNSSGLGIFKTAPGAAIFFLPESSVSAQQLQSIYGSQTYLGITFDSASENSVKQIRVVSSEDGQTFTVKPYADPEAGQIDNSANAYKDVIEIKQGAAAQNDFPRKGFFLARVSRVMNGSVTGRGDLACMAHYTPANGATIFCSGTNPSNVAFPYTIAINSPRTTPAKPLSITAGNGPSVGSLAVAWTDGSSNETGFEVQTSLNGTTWVGTTLAPTVTTHTKTGLTAGATYQVRVRALGADGNSDWKSTTGQARASGAGPAGPTNLQVTSVGQSQVTLTWSPSTSTYQDFLKSQDGINWETVATLAGTAAGYQAANLATGTLYYFRVLAHNGTSSNAYSNTVSALTLGSPVKAPTLTATATAAGIQVNWTLQSANTSLVYLERSLYGGSGWTVIAGFNPSVTGYLDRYAFLGTRYYYRVNVRVANGSLSPYSNVADAVSISEYDYSSHQNKILTDNPIVYFNFDAASGNFVQDLTPNHFLGSLRGGSNFVSSNALIPFKKKTAFNGSDGYLTTPDDLRLRLKTFSLEVWFRVNGNAGNGIYNTILSKGSLNNMGADENYALMVHHATGKFFARVGMSGFSAPEVWSDVRVDDGNWHHGVFTIRHEPYSLKNDVALYVDGVLQTTAVWNGGPIQANGPLDIGTWRIGLNNLYGPLNGDIGEVAIYGYELSPGQVANHYSY